MIGLAKVSKQQFEQIVNRLHLDGKRRRLEYETLAKKKELEALEEVKQRKFLNF